jgi:GAF domain-containing protein
MTSVPMRDVLPPTPTSGHDPQLSVHLAIAEFLRGMHTQVGSDPGEVWAKITTGARSHLPAVGHASITVVEHRDTVRSRASTGAYPVVLDHIQRHFREGPSLESARDQTPCRVDDATGETRWPNFIGNAVASTPIRSMLSFPLFSDADASAVLNLFADQPQAFGADGVEIGQIFAINAAVIVEAGLARAQSRSMLTNRDVIGQAKGILMERFDIDAGIRAVG